MINYQEFRIDVLNQKYGFTGPMQCVGGMSVHCILYGNGCYYCMKRGWEIGVSKVVIPIRIIEESESPIHPHSPFTHHVL